MNFDKESISEEFFFFFFFFFLGGGGERGRGSVGWVPTKKNKIQSHLIMDPKQYAEFQDPILSNSLHIVLTRFFYCNNSKVSKGA